MRKIKFMQRTIGVVMILGLLNFLGNGNTLYSQGPNAPEASSFEPLDVTDVVNLVTGDFTYTIPTIEVPGPNGGYPLTLSYHSGIAMDQEASWVGLGWSLNPGAINRNVNGFPDDWNNVKSYEYYWNQGDTVSQHTLDVSIPIYPGISLGLGASWGSLRGFSGTVGVGLGIKDIGELNLGVSTNGDFSVGLEVVSEKFSEHIGLGVNFGTRNGVMYGSAEATNLNDGSSIGISVNGSEFSAAAETASGYGVNSNGSLTFTAMGMSLSTIRGGGFSISDNGTGASYFSTSLKQDDITIKSSGFSIPLVFINYRYEKVKWYADRLKDVYVSGSLYSDSNILNAPQDAIDYCVQQYGVCDEFIQNNTTACDCIAAKGVGYGYTGTQSDPDYAFTDISEINISQDAETFSILNNNPVLLNHDGYAVSGQGMAGNMSPKAMKNIALVNVNHDFEAADLSYYKPDDGQAPQSLNFYFENELAGGSQVNEVTFSNVANPTNFDSYVNTPSTPLEGNKRSGSFVEHFTYGNLPTNLQLPANFSQPSFADNNSIAGFRITSVDGVTYTYMLAVYNRMEKSRSFNYLDAEREVYSEKTNEAYATHWLLTSITGPDYVDANTDGKLDEGDYGYWVDFEYGKWSEGMVWRTPGKGDEYSKIQGSRRYTWGIKELYYLDKISTRTHSALFVKELREDAKGVPQRFIYKNQANDFLMPSQKQLRLNKIVVVQNDRLAPINKTNAYNITASPNDPHSFLDPRLNKTYSFSLNLQDNVLDTQDGFAANLEQDAIRVVSFVYDYALAQNSPNSDVGGKLTLKKLFFKGKGGISLMPPYSFDYSNNPDWNYNDENYWGYNYSDATVWNLDEITTPQGAVLSVEYQGDEYDNYATNANYQFRDLEVSATALALEISADVGNYDLKHGDEIYLDYDSTFSDCESLRDVRAQYSGRVALVEKNQNTSDFRTVYEFDLLEPQNYTYTVITTYSDPSQCNEFSIGAPSFTNVTGTPFKDKNHAGVRVSAIKVSDNTNIWKTAYEYGIGSVPYEPFYNFKGVRHQSLIRSPNVLYDKVTVRNFDNNDVQINSVKTVYEFITDKTVVPGITAKLSANSSSVAGTFNSFNSNDTRDITYDYKDYQGIIGNLKSVSTYQGSVLLSKQTNEYKFLDESSGFVNTASTQMYKSVNPKPGDVNYVNVNHLISTSYTKYPLVLESQKTVQGGIANTIYFDKHDLNSGKLLETRFFRSDGTEYKSVAEPAYTKYPEMGSKEDNSSYRHMLTQEAAGYTLLKKNGSWVPIAAGITTWNNAWSYYDAAGTTLSQETDPAKKVWRKHETYTWDGTTDSDGLFSGFDLATDDNFNWNLNGAQTNADWKKIATTNMYDRYSIPLEVMDINGNKASTKMGDKHTKVYVTSNAAYDEMYYSGAEDENNGVFGGGVQRGSATITSDAHTGQNALLLSAGQNAYQVTVKHTESSAKKYKISLWAKQGNHANTRINVGGSEITYNANEEIRAGDWVQLNFYADISNNTVVFVTSNGGGTTVDDFRLHPIASGMTSYVYNEWDELTHILGSNNMATKYIYDSMGRLIGTETEVADYNGLGSGGFKKISENEYTYKY